MRSSCAAWTALAAIAMASGGGPDRNNRVRPTRQEFNRAVQPILDRVSQEFNMSFQVRSRTCCAASPRLPCSACILGGCMPLRVHSIHPTISASEHVLMALAGSHAGVHRPHSCVQ
jgi:hypothetical protein